jgi:ABC-type branched-subunit amino acid transport system substrate-binding protein
LLKEIIADTVLCLDVKYYCLLLFVETAYDPQDKNVLPAIQRVIGQNNTLIYLPMQGTEMSHCLRQIPLV